MSRFKIQPTTRPSEKSTRAVEDFERAGSDPEDSPAKVQSATTSDGRKLLLWSPMTFHHDQPGGWHTTARVGDDASDDSVVAGEFSYGKGKLVVIGAPTPALNGTIDADGNLDFLLGYLSDHGDAPVILDEWSHGVGHEATVLSFLYSVGLVPVLAQLALLAGLYLWSNAGIRSPDDIAVARRPSSAEQIETLGFLYSRSLSRELTFARVQAEVERRMTDALHCRPDELAAQFGKLSAQTARGAAIHDRYQQLLARLGDARPVKTVHCLGCGYDLLTNRNGVCPGCNKLMPLYQRNELAELSADPKTQPGRKASRPDAVYAEVLTSAHQLAQEIQRERRAAR
jgi:hypothetical protein